MVQAKDQRGHCEISKEITGSVISGFRVKVAENCARLGNYRARSGNSLPTFRDNLSGPVLNPEDGTDTLSRNVYKKLPLLAA